MVGSLGCLSISLFDCFLGIHSCSRSQKKTITDNGDISLLIPIHYPVISFLRCDVPLHKHATATDSGPISLNVYIYIYIYLNLSLTYLFHDCLSSNVNDLDFKNISKYKFSSISRNYGEIN